jgi:hypothetical protein
MASQKISDMTAATSLASSVIPIVQGGDNKKADISLFSASRVQTVTSAGTVTANASTDDSVHILAQAEPLTIANPGGTAGEDQMLVYRIEDNATPQTIAYGSEFRAMGVTLPTLTVSGKTLYLPCVRNVTDTKWDVIAVVQQA